jgi:hypothetical protein
MIQLVISYKNLHFYYTIYANLTTFVWNALLYTNPQLQSGIDKTKVPPPASSKKRVLCSPVNKKGG